VKTPPDWLKEARAEHGARFLAGTETRTEAESAVAALILAHPEYLAEQAAVAGAAQVAAWVKANASCGDLFQASLFPHIPALMQVSVGNAKWTAEMTGEDLDNAKAMVLTRARNAREAADRARKDFTAFYKQVRPLLTGDRTVADALADLAAKAA
jgi:hypothetical protein